MISTNKGINSKPTENRLMAGREFQRLLRRWRFIPAWAGNTPRSFLKTCPPTVHPRVGGEHYGHLLGDRIWGGSSPRGRGTPSIVGHKAGEYRFIPAWAGNTSLSFRISDTYAVHPRVGGEHGTHRAPERPYPGSSPRGRGTLPRVFGVDVNLRFIPAWAGNTKSYHPPGFSTTVHPRVGGEHTASDDEQFTVNGSSPRGRGTRPPEGAALD